MRRVLPWRQAEQKLGGDLNGGIFYGAEQRRECRQIQISFAFAKEKERASAIMHDFCFTIPYGLAVIIGGVVGYVRKGSVNSLAGGLGTGLLLLLAGQMSLKAFEKRRNSYFAIFLQTVCSSVLTWVMGQRYLMTSKIMPAGIVTVISAVMTLFYLYKITKGGNHIGPKKE